MKLIAHRGYKINSIENTIESFNNAYYDEDFVGIELDVRKTKDNKLVVLHDFFINRVSDGSGLVKYINYTELLKYNFNTKKNKQSILLLSEVVEKYKDKIILIELKDRDITIDDLKKYNIDNVYIMSFNKKQIKNLKNTKYKLGYLNYGNYSEYDLEYDFIVLNKYLITDNIINFYKKHNILIFVWGLFKNNKVFFSDLEYPYFIVDDKKITFQTI